MNSNASGPAGAIDIALTTRDGRVDAVRLSSTRPTDFSRRLFAGKDVDQLLDALPRVFSVCATAQSSAAVQAVEQAAGIPVSGGHMAARELLVLAETAREHLFRILLGWSAWLGVPPPAARLAALGRMRGAWTAALYPGGDGFRPGGGGLAPERAVLDGLLAELDGLIVLALGIDRDGWVRVDDAGRLRHWATGGDAIAQRMVGAVIARGIAGLGASTVTPLPDIPLASVAVALGGPDADAFVASPQWDGRPRETGALPRQSAVPLVAALQRDHGNGVLTRQVARLSELVATRDRIGALLGRVGPAPVSEPPGVFSGEGAAQVEAARGRLVHRVVVNDGVVGDYRILAPTEWNFHPRGALAQGLLTLPANDSLAQLGRLLVDAIDPCVESHLVVDDDA